MTQDAAPPRSPAARLVVVSGPSGVGKTTVCAHLLERPGFERVITATTRSPRGAEKPGVDYVFLGAPEFDRWVKEGRFLEWAEVHGKRYGSPRAPAQAILSRGHHAVLNIDVQGARSVRTAGLPAFLVFLLPPSQEELERRLRGRGTESEEAVGRRMAAAREEMALRDEFDLQVVNDDSRRAAEAIAAALRPL